MVTICIALKLPERSGRSAREISEYLATVMPSHLVLGRPFDREGGRIPQPHATLYQGETDDARPLWRNVQEAIGGQAAVRSENTVYRHNPVGAVEAHWDASPQWLELQRKVVDAAHEFCGVPPNDPSGVSNAEIMEWLREHPERANQLRMMERYKFREIGGDFSPHATLSWLDSRHEARPDGLYTPAGELTREEFLDLAELEERYPAAGFDGGVHSELACFELGRFGTCVEQIGETVVLRPGPDLRALQAATAGIATGRRPGPAVPGVSGSERTSPGAAPTNRPGRTDRPSASL